MTLFEITESDLNTTANYRRIYPRYKDFVLKRILTEDPNALEEKCRELSDIGVGLPLLHLEIRSHKGNKFLFVVTFDYLELSDILLEDQGKSTERLLACEAFLQKVKDLDLSIGAAHPNSVVLCNGKFYLNYGNYLEEPDENAADHLMALVKRVRTAQVGWFTRPYNYPSDILAEHIAIQNAAESKNRRESVSSNESPNLLQEGAEGVVDFFENLGEKTVEVAENVGERVSEAFNNIRENQNVPQGREVKTTSEIQKISEKTPDDVVDKIVEFLENKAYEPLIQENENLAEMLVDPENTKLYYHENAGMVDGVGLVVKRRSPATELLMERAQEAGDITAAQLQELKESNIILVAGDDHNILSNILKKLVGFSKSAGGISSVCIVVREKDERLKKVLKKLKFEEVPRLNMVRYYEFENGHVFRRKVK